MNLLQDHRAVRLLVADYLGRTALPWVVWGLVYILFSLFWPTAEGEFEKVKVLFAFCMFVLASLPGIIFDMDSPCRSLNMLPLSSGDKRFAVLVQLFVFPFLLTTAIYTLMTVSITPHSLSAILGKPLSTLPAAWLLWTTVNAFSLSTGMLFNCITAVLLSTGVEWLQRHRLWLNLAVVWGYFLLGETIVVGMMLALPPVPASGAFAFAALLFVLAFFVLWRHAEHSIGNAHVAPPEKPSRNTEPVFTAVRHHARQWPLVRALKIGLWFCPLALLGIASQFKHGLRSPSVFIVFPVFLSVLGIALWMPSFRALRMLPLRSGQVARLLVGIQLALSLPFVLVTCLVSVAAAAYTGELRKAVVLVGCVLGGEAMGLLALPVCLKYWEKVYMVLILGLVFGSGYVDDLARTSFSYGIIVFVILALLAVIALPLSVVVAPREVEKFLAVDTRAYLKRTVFFFWREF